MQPCCKTSPRTGPVWRLALVARCAAAMLALSASVAKAQQFDYDPDGYWKMPSAPATKGEFGGEDPIGLASRQHIPTDCAINWKDEETGKTFCFGSAMSSQIFQDERTSILPKATAFWATEHAQAPAGPKISKPGAIPPASEPSTRP